MLENKWFVIIFCRIHYNNKAKSPFCAVFAERDEAHLRPHGSIDLGEEKPTRPQDRTNSSIWENRFSQSYEGRIPPPSAGTLGGLGMPWFAGAQAPHDPPLNSYLPIKQKSINHASSTHHLGISGYWTFSILIAYGHSEERFILRVTSDTTRFIFT